MNAECLVTVADWVDEESVVVRGAPPAAQTQQVTDSELIDFIVERRPSLCSLTRRLFQTYGIQYSLRRRGYFEFQRVFASNFRNFFSTTRFKSVFKKLVYNNLDSNPIQILNISKAIRIIAKCGQV